MRPRQVRILLTRFGRTNLKRIVLAVLVLAIVLHYLLKTPPELNIPSDVHLDQFPPFEPEVLTDFNEDERDTPKIPRILHQTWRSESVPPKFVENIESFVRNNPTWEYYLWTDASARELIKDHYSWLLPIWDGYSYSLPRHRLRKANALRYVVLYHYGGVYADFDTICYRSLEKAITKHRCVLTPEPYENAVIRRRSPHVINNVVMACAAKHPFFYRLMEGLGRTEHYQGIDSSGQGYVTMEYKVFYNLTPENDGLSMLNNRNDLTDNSPYFSKVNLPMSDDASIYIANTRYFGHSLDKRILEPLVEKCMDFNNLSYLDKRACVNAKRLGLTRARHKYAFIDHTYDVTNIQWDRILEHVAFLLPDYSVPIRNIVPYAKIYKRF